MMMAVIVQCLFLTLLLYIKSYYCQEHMKCSFNFTYEENTAVYNFSRLAALDEWELVLDDHKTHVHIAVCHPFPGLADSNSLVKYGNGSWFVMLSDIGTYQRDPQSKPRSLVLELLSMQSCNEGRNYSVKFYFKCSTREEAPNLLDIEDGCTLLLSWETPTACPVNSNCMYRDFDLSSLQHSDHYVVSTSNGSTFHLNICGNIRSGPCGNNNIAACEVVKNPKENKTITIGLSQGQRLTASPEGGLSLTYSTSAKGPKTEIHFVCNVSAGDIAPVLRSRSAKTFVFEIETQLACNYLPQECIVQDSREARYDLSPLRKSEGNWDTQSTYSGVQYHLNVCGPLNYAPEYPCIDGVTGACRTDSQTGKNISLGYSTGPRIVASNILVLSYTGGSLCPSGGRHSAHIEFSCSSENRSPVFMEQTKTCVHRFVWETSAACPSLLSLGKNCMVTEKLYGHQFDLGKLHSHHSLTTDSGDTYNINVCGALNSTCNGKNASVCLTRQGREYAIGYVNTSVVYENGALRFELYGEGCKPGRNSSKVYVLLLCRQGPDLGQPDPFPDIVDCNFYFVWYTSTACPQARDVGCTVTNNGSFYDLSPLTEIDSNYIVLKQESKLKFLLNVCHSIVFGQDAACQYSSAACLLNMSNPDPTSRFSNIGDVPLTGPYFENGKLKLKYDRGDICTHPSGPDHISTIITFECVPDVITELDLLDGDVCVYEFLLRTLYACPISSSHSSQELQNGDCAVMDPITQYRIDLNLLRNQVQTVSSARGHTYSFVACGNLTSGPCGSVGMCLVSEKQSAGLGNSRLHYEMGAVYLNYTGGAPCNGSVARNTVIEFVCAADIASERISLDDSDVCSYWISWHTLLACSKKVECMELFPLARVDENYVVKEHGDMAFYINICRPVLPVLGMRLGLRCPGGSMACLKHGQTKSLGHIPTLTKEKDGNLTLTYTGGSPCDSNPHLNHGLTIHFVCDPRSGKGDPLFVGITSPCHYEFIWKTSITCKSFKMDLMSDTCVVHNEQVDASMKLNVLDNMHISGVHRNYTLQSCSTHSGIFGEQSNIGILFGTLTSAVIDYHNQEVSLEFTDGSDCSGVSSEKFWAQLLLKCDRTVESSLPMVVTENDCGVVMEWSGSLACDVFIPDISKSVNTDTDTGGISVGLVVSLIIVAALLCSLVLYFRKPANCSHLKSRLTSAFGIRHHGRFHYSRESDGEWTDH